MITSFLTRGMAVGLVAGVLAFGFGKVFGEPPVESAIEFEAKENAAKMVEHAGHHHEDEPELFSRKVQSGVGLLVATVVFSIAMGGLFGLAFAVAYGRVRFQPRTVALLVAGAGFVSFALMPALKYPPNPPSVGQAETIGLRTATYFLMMLASALTICLAITIGRQFVARLGVWNATIIGAIGFVVVISIVMYVFPEINEVPDGFSAVVLWRFRIASIGMQAVVWATLGILLGFLTERNLQNA